MTPDVPPLPLDVEFVFPPLLTGRGQDLVIKAFGAQHFRTICDYYFNHLKKAQYVFTNEPLRKVPSESKELMFFHLNNDVYVVKTKPFAMGGNKFCHFSVKLNTCEEVNISRTSDPFVHQEISILEFLKSQRSLGYHHISHLRTWCISNSEIYQFSDYANQKSLSNFMRNRKITHDLKLNFTKQILLGLSFIHSNGYIHLDIKPNNLLISEYYEKNKIRYSVKVCDFGAAVQAHNFEQKYGLRGTQEYFSPEQKMLLIFLQQEPTGTSYETLQPISSRSDIYSLGLTLQVLFGNNSTSYKDFWAKKWGDLSPLVSITPSERPTANDCLVNVNKNIRRWNAHKNKKIKGE